MSSEKTDAAEARPAADSSVNVDSECIMAIIVTARCVEHTSQSGGANERQKTAAIYATDRALVQVCARSLKSQAL